LIGALPALVTFWIRANIPEPEEWETARTSSKVSKPGLVDLFKGEVLKTTVMTILGLLRRAYNGLGAHLLDAATVAEPAGYREVDDAGERAIRSRSRRSRRLRRCGATS